LTWLGFYLFFFGPGKWSIDYLIFDRRLKNFSRK